MRLNSKLVGFDETPDGVIAQLRGRRTPRSRATCSSAPTGCARPSASLLFGEQEARFTGVAAWRALIPWRTDAARASSAQIVVWFGRGRHAMTYPIRADLCRPSTRSSPPTEIRARRGARRATSTHLRRSFAGASATCWPSSTASPRRSSRRSTSATRCRCGARTAIILWATPPTRRRRARARAPRMALEDAVDARRVPAPRGRTRRRAGRAGRVRRAPPGRGPRRCSSPRGRTSRCSTSPIRSSSARATAGSPGCCAWIRVGEIDVRLALRPRRDAPPPSSRCRRRRRTPQAHAASRGAAGVRAVARRARARGPRRLWRRRARGLRALHRRDRRPPRRRRRSSRTCRRPALRVVPPGADEDLVVLHLHGGGYTMGSARGAVAAGRRGWRRRRRLGARARLPARARAPVPGGAGGRRSPPIAGSCASRSARIDRQRRGAGGGLAVALAVAARDEGLAAAGGDRTSSRRSAT